MATGNVLVIGSGGREHAIVWKLSSCDKISAIFVAPGNAGTSAEPKSHNVGNNLFYFF